MDSNAPATTVFLSPLMSNVTTRRSEAPSDPRPVRAKSALQPSARPAQRIEDEILQLLIRQSRRSPLPILIACGIIAAFAANFVPRTVCVIWLLAVVAVFVLRARVLSYLNDAAHMGVERKLKIAALLSFLSGAAHGSSLFFFPQFPELERAVQTVILVGLSTGAIATTAGYRPVFLPYFIPAFTPVVPLWLLSPGLERTGWLDLTLGVLLFFYGLLLLGLARDAFRTFTESFEIRSQHEALNRRLAQALTEAEAASRAKTRFLASASHDLRQPIHTLSLFSAALSMQNLDDRSRAIAQHINVALDTLTGQIDALLDVSKLDAGVMEMQVAAFDLRPALLRLVDEFRPLCADKGLSLNCSLPAEPLYVETDPALFERVLRNLLSNAVKYTDTGSVSIEAATRSGKTCLSISDTGRGIPANEHERVFEEFYQLDNPERDRSKGLGLGLAIVKRLVRMLDIELILHSTPGRGACFELGLPGATTPATSPQQPAGPEPRQQRLTVLVIDDEAEVRIGMQTLLGAMGHEVTLADSTEQAMALARTTPPQLVLADLRLRGADNGISAIQSLRRIRPDLPALLISGDTAPDRLKEAQRAGIKLLHKPVALGTLRQAIREACEGAG